MLIYFPLGKVLNQGSPLVGDCNLPSPPPYHPLIMAMFGLILAGQLVRTDSRVVSPTQVVFDIPDASKSNHVVVFLTGTTPFPEGHGGAVYLGTTPDDPAEASAGLAWVLLGHLSNEKPSAIFKISGLKKAATAASSMQNSFFQGAGMAAPVNQPGSNGAQIGIMVAPIAELAQQTPASAATAPTADAFAQFTTKMCSNFFNYASSFAATPSQITAPIGANEQFVSMNVVKKWFDNFSRRMALNPNYWKDL